MLITDLKAFMKVVTLTSFFAYFTRPYVQLGYVIIYDKKKGKITHTAYEAITILLKFIDHSVPGVLLKK